MLLADAFTTSHNQKSLRPKTNKRKKGGWAQFSLKFLAWVTRTNWEEMSVIPPALPLPDLCHTITLPHCYLSSPQWWRLLLWSGTVGRHLCRGQDTSIAMIRVFGAASAHKIQTPQCKTKYVQSFSVPTPASLFGADCRFPELCSLLVFPLPMSLRVHLSKAEEAMLNK